MSCAAHEGKVVKPPDFISRGRRGYAQRAIKRPGPEYLRIIYGPEYLMPDNLEALACSPKSVGTVVDIVTPSSAPRSIDALARLRIVARPRCNASTHAEPVRSNYGDQTRSVCAFGSQEAL